jgi:hypothetical protein
LGRHSLMSHRILFRAALQLGRALGSGPVATYALKGPFFALSSEWLAGTAAAAGLAQINALGNLAGFVDSFLIGYIQGETGSYALALLPLVGRRGWLRGGATSWQRTAAQNRSCRLTKPTLT